MRARRCTCWRTTASSAAGTTAPSTGTTRSRRARTPSSASTPTPPCPCSCSPRARAGWASTSAPPTPWCSTTPTGCASSSALTPRTRSRTSRPWTARIASGRSAPWPVYPAGHAADARRAPAEGRGGQAAAGAHRHAPRQARAPARTASRVEHQAGLPHLRAVPPPLQVQRARWRPRNPAHHRPARPSCSRLGRRRRTAGAAARRRRPPREGRRVRGDRADERQRGAGKREQGRTGSGQARATGAEGAGGASQAATEVELYHHNQLRFTFSLRLCSNQFPHSSDTRHNAGNPQRR